MRLRAVRPTRNVVGALAALGVATALALLAGVPQAQVNAVAGAALALALAGCAIDLVRGLRSLREAPLRIERRAPTALALGAPTEVVLHLFNEGARDRLVTVFDTPEARLAFEDLPQTVRVPAASRAELRYRVTALRRGPARFGATELRTRTAGGCFELQHAIGDGQVLRVYPNFAAVAGYAWLAGDRRLAQMGIKTYAQRGLGTDFRQLAEYTPGAAVRDIDWKATLRQGKPIVRQYQDERDQRVLFLLDCGRRMRASDGARSHFDQALDALMLLAYVALREGDEFGALTFGNRPGEQRDFAPRKGVGSLNALMNRLYDLEPAPVHSDYLQAAGDLMRHFPRRALVVLLTNFRDEDSAELRPAIRLLRTRHLVLVASLREKVLDEVAAQPLAGAEQAVEVAAAHLFAQSRRDAFARVVDGDPLSVDVEPAQLPVALVNRYHAVKRAGWL